MKSFGNRQGKCQYVKSEITFTFDGFGRAQGLNDCQRNKELYVHVNMFERRKKCKSNKAAAKKLDRIILHRCSDFHANYGRFLVIIKTQKANSPTNNQKWQEHLETKYISNSNSNSNKDILINIAGVALNSARNKVDGKYVVNTTIKLVLLSRFVWKECSTRYRWKSDVFHRVTTDIVKQRNRGSKRNFFFFFCYSTKNIFIADCMLLGIYIPHWNAKKTIELTKLSRTFGKQRNWPKRDFWKTKTGLLENNGNDRNDYWPKQTFGKQRNWPKQDFWKTTELTKTGLLVNNGIDRNRTFVQNNSKTFWIDPDGVTNIAESSSTNFGRKMKRIELF